MKIVTLILFIVPLLVAAKSYNYRFMPESHMGDFDKNQLILDNQWLFWANYNGALGADPYARAAGGYFTKKRFPVVYTEGLLWGGLVQKPDAGNKIDRLRVGGMYYQVGTTPGRIITAGGQMLIDHGSAGIYRVRKNWQTMTFADLKKELTFLTNLSEEKIPNYLVRRLKEKYAHDWQNWPIDHGAPFNDVNENGLYDPVLNENGFPQVDQGDYPGIAEADETIFMVVNDLDTSNVLALSGTLPIGLELQITLWAYDTDFPALGNTVFHRFVFINKSSMVIDSMYIQDFLDPDIGDYDDDFCGCDSLLSLAFAYNASDQDAEALKMNLIPPAVGVLQLQGPMIESPGDTAQFNFKKIPGFKNLPMTSFNFLRPNPMIDPIMGHIEFALRHYNMMRGYFPTNDLQHPTPQYFESGPRAGQPTKFPLSGDPVNDPDARYGDVDGQGQNGAPGDRRIYINSGPFRMNPGETQEIIYAIIGGLGADHREGITQIKKYSRLLRLFYENGFKEADLKPPVPDVKALSYDQSVLLNWGWNEEKINEIEQRVKNGFRFEGYNVYQLPDSEATLEDPQTVKLATFDLDNGIKTIEGLIYDFKENGTFIRPLQIGKDSGIQRFLIVKRDSIKHRPLYRGSTYYFAVTSYNYNPQFTEFPAIESDYKLIKVTIEGQKPGWRLQAKPQDQLEVTASEVTDVRCLVDVVDPSMTTDHEYQVFFTFEEDASQPGGKRWFWHVKDLTSGQDLLQNKPVLTCTNEEDFSELGNDVELVDGLLIKVLQPEPGIKAIVQVADAEGPLTPDEYDATGKPFNGNNVWHDPSSANDENPFYISAGGGIGNLEQITRSIGNAEGHDFELRFTDEGGIYTWWYDADVYAKVPFEAWDVGVATYDDQSDDIRCLTGGLFRRKDGWDF